MLRPLLPSSNQVICSATRLAKRKCPITGQKIQVGVPVWNWVVANVSLMAVGSRCVLFAKLMVVEPGAVWRLAS
jgi:hypothetical protein